MKKLMVALMATVLIASVGGAQAAFTTPTGAQITAAAENPVLIKDLLKDATVAQASVVLLNAVQEVQKLSLSPDLKKEQVGKLFAAVQEAMGEDAILVISDVARRMNPNLLPAVAAPGAAIIAQPALPIAQPLAPPAEPIGPATPPPPPTVSPYPGQ